MGHSIYDETDMKEMEVTSLSSSQRKIANSQPVYKVGFPLRRKLVKEFIERVKETFSDEPLREYKDQPKSRKFILGLQSVFPILEWGRHYNLRKFKGDVIAGLTIASLYIPQDIG